MRPFPKIHDLYIGRVVLSTVLLTWTVLIGMDAIVSGCLQAQAGAVERMFEQVAAYSGAICLVSGGAAGQLFDLLRVPKRHVDNLVLEGLARMG